MGRARRVPVRRALLFAIASACALAIPTASVGQAGARERVKAKRVLLIKGDAVQALAASAGYVAWIRGRFSGRGESSPVFERDLATGRTRKLVGDSSPQFGLATTRDWVVYARTRGSSVALLAVEHGGGASTTLTRSLLAPFAARGERIAWAEQTGSVQRVVVRDMRTGRNWIAARLNRCEHGRCYRIDAVTLADRGVVFTRGAIGSQPSLIVRRGFGDARVTTIPVRGDPQPDLAPSSTGALFYSLRGGWRRWDFGRRERPLGFKQRGWWILGSERGRLLLMSSTRRCRPATALAVAGGRTVALPAPTSTPASPKEFGRLCRVLTDVAWRGSRLLVAWAVLPELTLRTHGDVGVVGVVTSMKTR